MHNPGFDSNTILNNDKHSTYFEENKESGEYVLKEGYEQRFLGSGDNVSRGGAESTFSNDYDDMHDSYEPDRDKKIYGIFKKPSNKSNEQAPVADKVTESPKADKKPTGPTELSPEIQQAKERVNKYENSIDGSQGSMFSTDEPDAQGFADKYKLNLLNKGATQQSDFSAV